MALYYRVSGLLADIALLLNVVLLPLGMMVVAGFLDIFSGSFQPSGGLALPVLTLPGIAGIALTVGMAVDANVLIFERIREELRAGKTFAGAIQAGYDRALTAIFDSNFTTIITAIILFLLGAGPVRGYAVTLTGGLIVSLYTAVVVTRMCFNLIAKKTSSPAVLSMFSLLPETKLDFMSYWKIALAASFTLIVVSWGIMVSHGLKNPTSVFGVDFTGGSAITLSYQKQVPVGEIRSALSQAGVKDAMIQYQAEMDQKTAGNLNIKVGGTEEGEIVKQVMAEKFSAAGFRLLQEDGVGPQVGRELKTKAVWAMFWSLVAMIIYISWRFEFGFALGAVGALFHDVLVTAGVCHLAGVQMNLTVVAALMTIVGYSVNDTIVIFDRIRENLRMVHNRSFIDICNLSMNQTLARTLLTNLLTLVTVLSLLIFGGGAIKDFSFAMFVGMLAGTYSTIYIATPIVLLWYRFKTPDLGKKTGVQ
jgi:SecD/SecF fusion protein